MKFNKRALWTISVGVFIALFYGQSIGLNLGLFGILLCIMTILFTYKKERTKEYWVFFGVSILTSLAYMWYGDGISFFGLYLSLGFLALSISGVKTQFIVKLIPLIASHLMFPFHFLTHIFGNKNKNSTEQDKNDKEKTHWLKNIIATIVIPVLITLVFFLIYSKASENFSTFLEGIFENINIGYFILILIPAIFFCYTFWYSAPKTNQMLSLTIDENIKAENFTEKLTQNEELERKSGEISFILLNILLTIFILFFSYENFFELNTTTLSQDTHQRINTVIISIVFAILIILIYFRGKLNFPKESKRLKSLALIWIGLNVLIILTAGVKNSQYIYYAGLTFKRLGVYAFLILSIVGLYFTFIKIKEQKTGEFLFLKMSWAVYLLIPILSVINWSYVVTAYNIQNNQGDYNYMKRLPFNKGLLLSEFKDSEEIEWQEYNNEQREKIHKEKNRTSFLSKTLYWEFINE